MEKLESEEFYQNNFIMPNDFIDKGYIKLFKKEGQLIAIMEVARFCFREGIKIGRALEYREQKKRHKDLLRGKKI